MEGGGRRGGKGRGRKKKQNLLHHPSNQTIKSSSSTLKHHLILFLCVPSCQAVIKRSTASFPLQLNWVPWAAAPPQDGRRAAEFFFPPPPPEGLVPADGFRKPAAEFRSAEGKKPSQSCFCTPAPLLWDRFFLNFISFYMCLMIFRNALKFQ